MATATLMESDSAEERVSPQGTEFSIGEARSIVKDLFTPSATIYWSDFLFSIGLGAFCFTAVENSYRPGRLVDLICQGLGWAAPGRWLLIGLLFVVQCLAFYRAALFTHELVHLREGAVRGFRFVWNLFCGIPFLMPSFLYHTHVHHHLRKQYGTHDDGEYLPLANGPRSAILGYLSQSFVIPVLAVVRFGLLTPLTWISPWVRRKVHQHASSMVIDPHFVRPLPNPKQLRLWRLQEGACLVYIIALGAALGFRLLPWTWLIHAYLTGVFIIMINAVRTLAAHRYAHAGGELTFMQQLLDSLNFPTRPWLNELWAPVGLRFHALHHLFPSLPYHALGRAHRRLMAELPANSPYRRTVARGLWPVLRELWASARASDKVTR
jgi:fatty acid desaturase